MERDRDARDKTPQFTWRRFIVTVLGSAAILGLGAYLVRAYPNSGYDAGYDAVMATGRSATGQSAIRADVDAAGGVSLPLCDALHAQVEHQPGEPHYDHDTFIEGCRDAVDELYGRHVPLSLPGS